MKFKKNTDELVTWYAWYPVEVKDGDCWVWLERIYRKTYQWNGRIVTDYYLNEPEPVILKNPPKFR